MKSFKYVFILAAVMISISASAQQTGTIKGKIIEQATKQPISGVSITVKERQLTVVSDNAGLFSISNIVPGTYSLTISHVGFQEKLVNDIPVVQAKTYYLETELLN